jgi:putative endonuclease
MSTHNIIGKKGEEIACNYLRDNKYIILETNWRHRRKEIDIIAQEGKEIVVVEVKTRTDNNFEAAHLAIDSKKIRCIVRTADAYMRYKDINLPVRFDTICIIKDVNTYSLEHIKDAFISPLD